MFKIITVPAETSQVLSSTRATGCIHSGIINISGRMKKVAETTAEQCSSISPISTRSTRFQGGIIHEGPMPLKMSLLDLFLQFSQCPTYTGRCSLRIENFKSGLQRVSVVGDHSVF